MTAYLNTLAKSLFKKLAPVLGGMIGLSLGSFLATARLTDISKFRLEQILSFSGIPLLFYLAFLASLCIYVMTIHGALRNAADRDKAFWRESSDRRLFAALFLPSVTMMLMLATAYLLLNALCGLLYAWMAKETMHNFLFLAFARAHSLRLLLPLSGTEFTRTVLLLFSPAAAALCGYFAYGEKKFEQFFWLFVWAVGYAQLTGLYQSIYAYSLWFLWARLVVVAVFTAYFIWRSIIFLGRRRRLLADETMIVET